MKGRSAGQGLLAAALIAAALAGAAWAAGPPGDLTIAQVRYGGGGDWYANPSSLPNLLGFIRERTGLPVLARPATIQLTDPGLRSYPYLYLTGHGNLRLSEREVAALRLYLDEGGFLHADDNYGLDESFRRELRRVYPNAALVAVPHDHPVYHTFYDFPRGLPKIHEHDGAPPQGLGVFRRGRLVVFYSYESDLGDGWEDPEVHDNAPEAREQALRMGLNLFLYALSQAVE
ncbi:MAG: DUF4159 domain-containing protein [Gemmatimonadota bacterium]